MHGWLLSNQKPVDQARTELGSDFRTLWILQTGRQLIKIPDNSADIHKNIPIQHVPTTFKIRQHKFPKEHIAIKNKHEDNKFCILSYI